RPPHRPRRGTPSPSGRFAGTRQASSRGARRAHRHSVGRRCRRRPAPRDAPPAAGGAASRFRPRAGHREPAPLRRAATGTGGADPLRRGRRTRGGAARGRGGAPPMGGGGGGGERPARRRRRRGDRRRPRRRLPRSRRGPAGRGAREGGDPQRGAQQRRRHRSLPAAARPPPGVLMAEVDEAQPRVEVAPSRVEPAPPPPAETPPAPVAPDRSRLQLLAAVVLSACLGLIGGAAAAWGIYQRLGPAQRLVQVGGPGGGSGTAPAVGSLVADVAPAVVEVVTRPVSASDLLAPAQGFASGFVVSGDGLVVTSAHAVQGATRLRIALNDGRVADAVIAG